MPHFSLLCTFLLTCAALAVPAPSLDKRYPTTIPAISYPAGGFAGNCPETGSNLFYQGIQKRGADVDAAFPFFEEVKPFNYSLPSEAEIEELRKRSLEPRQYKSCTNVARFEWLGFNRPLGNTQDIYLSKGSTYTFSISASVGIKLAYAWSAPFNTNTYTLVATGGGYGQTATVTVKPEQDSTVHFQAFSDYTMSDGAVVIFKQDM